MSETNNLVVDYIKKIDNSIVIVAFKDNVTIDLEQIKDTYAKLHAITGNEIHKKLIITGKHTQITKDARLYGMNESKRISKNVDAEAIVVHSLYQKMVINFYNRFIENNLLVKSFTDVEKAKEWLQNLTISEEN
jgi:hypothetical protein